MQVNTRQINFELVKEANSEAAEKCSFSGISKKKSIDPFLSTRLSEALVLDIDSVGGDHAEKSSDTKKVLESEALPEEESVSISAKLRNYEHPRYAIFPLSFPSVGNLGKIGEICHHHQ